MRKKLFLILTILLTAVSGAWADDEGECGDGVTWSYDKVNYSLTIKKNGSGTGVMTDYDDPNNRPWNDYKDKINRLTVESGVTTIGKNAFRQFKMLYYVNIHEGVTSFGMGAFQDCIDLASIDIPANVTTIGSNAFVGCTNLGAINVADGNTNYSSDGGVLFNKAKTTLIQYPANKAGVSYTIPSTVTSIGGSAFQYCSKLTSVTVYAPSCSLGSNAFDNCTSDLKIYVFNEKVEDYKAAENWSSYAGKITGLNGGYCGTTGHETEVMWLLTGNTLTIWGTGAMADYASFENCPWYSHRENITSVEIESGVTTIGNNAFTFCTNLASINIRAGVTSIGEGAFLGCTSLASINIPTGVTSIGEVAFGGCTGLASINIPASVESIGANAFLGCAFTSFTIPANVTSIGEQAFAGCSSLASVFVLATTPPTLGTEVFEGNASGRKIYVPSASYSTTAGWSTYASAIETITASGYCGTAGHMQDVAWTITGTAPNYTLTISGIGAMANYDPNALPWKDYLTDITSVTIGDGVTSIGMCAFYSCTNLTSVSIPTSVTSIGMGAFSNCTNMASISIPASVTGIGNYAFNECSKLTAVTFDGTSTLTTIGEGAFKKCAFTSFTLPASVTSIGNAAFDNCTSLSSFNFPAGVTSIGVEAFNGCTKLASIAFAANTQLKSTNIGYNAFQGCTKLKTVNITGTGVMKDYIGDFNEKQPWNSLRNQITTVTIGEGVTRIGNSAFLRCNKLTSVTIPATVITINSYAFDECTSIESITIPASVTNISYRAFYGCSNLASITFAANTPLTGSPIVDEVFGNCNNLKTLVISGTGAMADYEGPEKQPWNSFRDQITTVTIGDGVTKIGKNAFYEFDNLSSVTIPAGVTTIGEAAFSLCDNLTSINVDANNQYYISDGGVLFNKAKTILLQYPIGKTDATYEIPATVTTIGETAFCENTNLTSITFAAGSALTTIGMNAFAECTNLTSVSIPTGVTNIGNGAFTACSNLTSVSIPVSVKSIGQLAFGYCNNLASITIPAGVESIGGTAFYHCTNLASVIVNATTPPALGVYAFDENASGHKIYVPAANVGTYKNATNWSAYASAIEAISASGTCGGNLTWTITGSENDYTLTISGTGAMTDYNLGNQPWSEYNDGIATVVIGDGVTTIGNNAFNSCTNLASVTIPAGVTSIGVSAFSGCGNLATITMNSSPLIGEEAFYNLKEGAEVTINAPANEADSYQWATFYNKTCSFKADENTQVFKVTLSGSTVTLLEVTDKIVNAGTAVVLKSTGNPIMTLTEEASSDTQGNNLVGTYETIINPGNAYVLNYTAVDGVGFYKLASTGTIEFGKAYLVATAGAREFLTFGETTGLSPIPSPKGEGSDVIYDIHGRRVNGKPSKGLYIINGKKIVMK